MNDDPQKIKKEKISTAEVHVSKHPFVLIPFWDLALQYLSEKSFSAQTKTEQHDE